jgi:hypothetical protein
MTQGIGRGSYLDMYGDQVLMPEDFERRKREDANGIAGIPSARQDDLRTIMIGHLMHLAGVGGLPWREALPSEIAECGQIMQATFAAYTVMLDAQADYALRCQAQAVEVAQARLARDPLEGDEADQAERAAAQAVLDAASIDVMQLVERRALHRAPPELTPGPTEET